MSQYISVLFSPFGVVARPSYWLGLIFVFMLFFWVFIISGFQEILLARGLGILRLPVIGLMIWSIFVLVMKRLRDASKSPLWVLALLVPVINLLAILFIGTLQKKAS